MTGDSARPRFDFPWLIVLLGGLLFLLGGAVRGAGDGPSTRVVSRGLDGGPALTGAAGEYLSASADGRYVAYLSPASNLGHDPRGRVQVCVKDRVTGLVTLASRNGDGAAADADCSVPVLSADGRRVAFISSASNLGPPAGAHQRIYWHDLQSGLTLPVAPGMVVPSSQDAHPATLALSGDGRWLAFCSADPGLVPGDTNQMPDVFLWDRQTGAFERVSVGAGGVEGAGASGVQGVAISAEGLVVAFASEAANLVTGDVNDRSDIFVRDRAAAETERVSRSPLGGELDGPSFLPALSGNGQRVAFVTSSSNVAPGQFFNVPALLVSDRSSGLSVLASPSVFGGVAFGSFGFSALSHDGRYLAFRSGANDLVFDDTAAWSDVFVRDLQTWSIELVNRPAGGGRSEGDVRGQGPVAITSDGNQVFFQSRPGDLTAGDENGRPDIFVRRRTPAVTERVSVAPDGSAPTCGARSRGPVVSADGRFVAFISDAFNLVPGDTNADDDVFVWDRQGSSLERVSLASDEQEAQGRSQVHDGVEIEAAMSADGRYVAFNSPATNLVEGDTNQAPDVFVRDRPAGATVRASVNDNGQQAAGGVSSGPSISADGRYVAFRSGAANLVPGDTNDKDDVFVRDRLLLLTERVSLRSTGGQSNHWVMEVTLANLTPRISADGRSVAWATLANDLVEGDTNGAADIFVRDRSLSTTERASLTSLGGEANGGSFDPRLSGDGQRVAFTSWAGNLSPDDANQVVNPYVRNPSLGSTERLDRDSTGEPGFGEARVHALNGDGRYALIDSAAPLTPEDTNGCRDLFLRDRVLGMTTRVSLGENGEQGEGARLYAGADLSPDARYLAFSTDAEYLTAGDTDRNLDVYVRDRGGLSPSPPTELRALAVSASTIRLDWTDTSGDETHFVVQRQSGGGAFTDLGMTAANVSTYLDTTLAPDTAYLYRVFAVNSNGASGPSNEVGETSLPLVPAAPTGLVATVVSDVAIQLSWVDQSDNEDGFEIQRRSAQTEYETIDTRPSGFRQMLDEGLTPHLTYFYRVRAYNRAGGSNYSDPASGMTFGPAGGRLSVTRAVNFGRARIGTPATRKVIFRNLDRRTGLRVSLGFIDGDFYGPQVGRTLYLQPAQKTEVLLYFDPSRKGVIRYRWDLTSSDRKAKKVRINLQGVGQLSF